MFACARRAQRSWARTPLHERATLLHRAATLARERKEPIAKALVREVAKGAKDAMTEVVRSADLIDYTAEEGVRLLGEGKLLMSDSFPEIREISYAWRARCRWASCCAFRRSTIR